MMKYLRQVGLVFSLLIVGVVVGLMAPLPSEALNSTRPQLTIDNVAVTDLVRIPNVLLNGVSVCPSPDTSYNSCWTIPNTNVTTDSNRSSTRRIGNWYVGDVSALNGARVVINDVNTVGGVDGMRLTGVTFRPVLAGSQTTNVVIVHTFNEGGGVTGDYHWVMGQGGHFDPPPDQKMYNDRLTLTGTSTVGSLGVLNVGPITSPDSNNLLGIVTKDNKPSKLIKAACTKCAPTVTYTYAITSIDFDVLVLTDSAIGCGGVCDPGDGTNKLLPCAVFLRICEDQITAASNADLTAGFAAGGVEVCDGDCIVTIVKVTPSNQGGGLTVDFDATGPGVTPFSITANAQGIGYHTFKDLATGPTVGTRTISVADIIPLGWQADQIICESLLKTTTWKTLGTSDKGPLQVLNLGDNDTFTCTWHVHTK